MTFEETYPQYPFADLVALGVFVAAMIVRHDRRHRDAIVAHGSGMEAPAAS